MEGCYMPTGPALHLGNFLAEYKRKLSDSGAEVPFFLQANPVLVDVGESCSLDMIDSPEDSSIINFQPGTDIYRPVLTQPQEGHHVPRTFSALSQHKAKSRKTAFTRTPYTYKINPPPADANDVVLNDYELEISVRVYRPPRAAHRGYKVEVPVFAEEYLCLGSNYLTDLRDKITCICAGKRFIDISVDPDAPLPTIDTNPGYFFINDTFYNDMRNPNNKDYSETVIQWANTAHGMQGDSFKVQSMEKTRFNDLTVSPGSPLHYLHHGNCEHLFVISQIEVLTPRSKRPNRSLYPCPRSYSAFNRRTCYMCGINSFHFIVEKSSRQLHDPSYLCRTCFLSFYYVDGQKVGHFKAYRIYDHDAEEPREIIEATDD
ncbi:snRNA-activating protein complex subunit 3 [Drosophila serrata]|uniref:snRNA-activating protein complex subunit 3 n=1 Tax=Drosophila serrata TaxID=7274 RepID=UPI000A1CFA20|nr:snRNA-activating protein complex subunit 3 [Drosophila serrata]